MKTLYTSIITVIFLVSLSKISTAQEDTSKVTPVTEDTTQSTEKDPVTAHIADIIKEVNNRASFVDNIISEGDIKVKTLKIDESGSIEIHLKKKDDVWFDITGTLGVRGAMAHFNRKNFVFFNSLADEVVMGSSTIINIGTLTKIRCTFDDLINAFSGTVHIAKGKSDILSMDEEGSQYVISLKRGSILRKYWVDKGNYSVYKYAYFGKSGSTLIQFEFSNFSSIGESYYAKKIEVRRPKQGEYFSINLDNVSLNQSGISFQVNYPSDVIVKRWK
jgi:hypothetical protein